MLAASKPDIVLMDIRLKGSMSGIEAAERMRDEYDIPVVFLTAYADQATDRAGPDLAAIRVCRSSHSKIGN